MTERGAFPASKQSGHEHIRHQGIEYLRLFFM